MAKIMTKTGKTERIASELHKIKICSCKNLMLSIDMEVTNISRREGYAGEKVVEIIFDSNLAIQAYIHAKMKFVRQIIWPRVL